jgi:hypothetical protein
MKLAVKSEMLGEKLVTVALYPAGISRGLDLDGIRVSAVGFQRLTGRTLFCMGVKLGR